MSRTISIAMADLLRQLGFRCGASTTDGERHCIVLVDGSEIHSIGEVAHLMKKEAVA